MPQSSDDQAQRRARHLRMCQRLGDLGIELAEAAHREALRDLQPPVQRRPSLPSLAGVPGLPVPPTGRDATFGQLFAQLSRSVRQVILLEARLAGGAYDRPPAAGAQPVAPATVPSAPHQTAPARPANAGRPRPEQVDDDLAGDLHRSAPEILAGICQELGAALDAGGSVADIARNAVANTDREGTPAIDRTEPSPRFQPLTVVERSAELADRTRPRPAPA